MVGYSYLEGILLKIIVPSFTRDKHDMVISAMQGVLVNPLFCAESFHESKNIISVRLKSKFFYRKCDN